MDVFVRIQDLYRSLSPRGVFPINTEVEAMRIEYVINQKAVCNEYLTA